ncbi:putative transcriptional regulator [Acinetobacter baylyi]|uniref:Transcriptional regulator n=1 Tax=Acinetobacter baylyi TaxID=202950 RepID=A0ABU0USY0_ACIBI|nr:helix-turn-helix domain-containing protein [Acinetobacter baylyi]MDQ1207551.1 putative transcriptional regulator [Acinetobacter baylyi]MDR6105373.1 putative transcriptional regulator [Acinetobacter baylyi]MDR6184417.1 putative transcriptional regulator [Acinetobacter baylyi]
MNFIQHSDKRLNNTLANIQDDSLSHEIVRIRRALNISQAQLASKLGISARTLESWERGVRHPSSSAQALIRLFIQSPHFVLENLS